MGRILTPDDVSKLTGMSAQKVRALCATGRLGAVNTSLGKRPKWAIPEESLNEFFTPAKARQEKAKAARRQAIDANVEKVF